MIRFILISCFLAVTTLGFTKSNARKADTLLGRLTSEIKKSLQYDRIKEDRISTIKSKLAATAGNDEQLLFEMTDSLYGEYAAYSYDSAIVYARKLQELAIRFQNPTFLIRSKISFGHTLLSAGLYKEAYDTLAGIHIERSTPAIKARYYALMARYYYDLAAYDYDPAFSVDYDKRGNRYIDSALNYFPVSSFEYNYYKGLKAFKKGDKEEARVSFSKIIDRNDLTDHQLAIVASTLSGIYSEQNNMQEAKKLLIRAAIADIQASTKETSATLDLAKLLFHHGDDIKNAFTCVEKANKDAIFYGARQRKIQVGTLMPLIEAQKISNVEQQKNSLMIYGIVVTLLLILLIILAITVYRQINKLKAAKKIITSAHEHLQNTNIKLSEANSIKEKYIAFFFDFYSKFYNKIERFAVQVEEKARDRKLDEIKFLINNIHLKKEKEALLLNFDKIFLSLFPGFVEGFNALLRPEEAIKLKEGELLNPDLRIFALIRMGIHDTDKIADILEYSVNTIYAYKAKIKNKAIVNKDEFEREVMKIKAI